MTTRENKLPTKILERVLKEMHKVYWGNLALIVI